eukprot:c11022_g1_i1.p1 GENE.c11022_g1_i1~~c11022_g1_i1.p1  ORF type:complete len:344 (+),score=76.79 c11022_g1_i1:31-1032(+)
MFSSCTRRAVPSSFLRDSPSLHLRAVQWAVTCRFVADSTVSGVKIKGKVGKSKVKVEVVQPAACATIAVNSGYDLDDISQSLQAPLCGGKKSSNSKSGSKFWFSECKRFFIKEVNDEEMSFCCQELSKVADHFDGNRLNLLSRVVGVYMVHIHGSKKNFVVITNLIEPKDEMIAMYDLKGTTENRLVKPSQFLATKTGKDGNFENHTIHLSKEADAETLRDALEADCDFLTSERILDYSMLVGICVPAPGFTLQECLDTSHHPVFVGTYEGKQVYFKISIIDTLQRWTPKKKAAHVFKMFSMRLVYEIDTEPPSFYQQRFLKKMNQKITSDQA